MRWRIGCDFGELPSRCGPDHHSSTRCRPLSPGPHHWGRHGHHGSHHGPHHWRHHGYPHWLKTGPQRGHGPHHFGHHHGHFGPPGSYFGPHGHFGHHGPWFGHHWPRFESGPSRCDWKTPERPSWERKCHGRKNKPCSKRNNVENEMENETVFVRGIVVKGPGRCHSV